MGNDKKAKKEILVFLKKQKQFDVSAQTIIDSSSFSKPTILKYLRILEAEKKIICRPVGNATLYRVVE